MIGLSGKIKKPFQHFDEEFQKIINPQFPCVACRHGQQLLELAKRIGSSRSNQLSNQDVLITGIGVISPLGKNSAENWTQLRNRQTGICHHPKNGLPEFLQYMGKISDYHLPDNISPKQRGQVRFLNRGARFGLNAVNEALPLDSDSLAQIEPGRKSLFVASGEHNQIGSEFMYPAIKGTLDRKWKDADFEGLNKAMMDKCNPFFLLESLQNNLFSFLSAYTGFMGPSTSLSSLPPCGSQAFELAYRTIKQNKADIGLAVGYGSWLSDIARYELEGIGLLSACRSGGASYRPFDRRWDGFIPGEGGAAIVLESAESAKKRGARVFGKVLGTSSSLALNEDGKATMPPLVNERSMMAALDGAGCSNADISFIVSHGSGTKKGDRSELESIQSVLGEDIGSVPVCALKPYTGHMGVASDLAEIVFGILAVNEGEVPATLNFKETEKAFSGLIISSSAKRSEKTRFLSTSYGVGGQSSSVIIDANPGVNTCDEKKTKKKA